MPEQKEITISWDALWKVVVTIAIVFLLVKIKDIILVFLTALIFASAIETWANAMERRTRIPYSICVGLIFIASIAFIGSLLYVLFPVVISQLQLAAPRLMDLMRGNYDIGIPIIDGFLPSVTKEANKYIGGATTSLFDLFGGLLDLLLVLAISFYLSIQGETIPTILRSLLGNKSRDFIYIWTISQRKFTDWLTTQLALMVLIGAATYIAMALLNIPNALLISIVAGLTEIIPFVGPILGAAFGALFAFTKGTDAFAFTILAFIVIQQVESHLIVPNLMKRATALNPVLVILSLLVGASIGGPVGALLAIPLMSAALEILKDQRDAQLQKEKE